MAWSQVVGAGRKLLNISHNICPLLFDTEILDGTVVSAFSTLLKLSEYLTHLIKRDIRAA